MRLQTPLDGSTDQIGYATSVIFNWLQIFKYTTHILKLDLILCLCETAADTDYSIFRRWFDEQIISDASIEH